MGFQVHAARQCRSEDLDAGDEVLFPTNLKHMRRFFKLYCPAPIGQQVADQLQLGQFEAKFPNVLW